MQMAVLLADVSGADGAAGALLCIRAVRDRRAPDMPLRAEPPDLSVAERSNLIRSQTSVAFRIPLCGDVWKERRQIILAGHHSLPSANRASRASSSAEYASSP